MPHNWPDRLRDILDAIGDIRMFVAGMDEWTFRDDRKTVMAVLAELAVIGDAVAHLPAPVQTRRPDVPWAEVCRMRNLVEHVYEGVDADKVWNVVASGLDPLEDAVRTMLVGSEA